MEEEEGEVEKEKSVIPRSEGRPFLGKSPYLIGEREKKKKKLSASVAELTLRL